MAASGISPPPPPSYPAAWASLPDGGYTAVRRAATISDVPSGFSPSQLYPEGYLVEVKQGDGTPVNTQTNYTWFEIPSGKVGAGSVGNGLFTSLDAEVYPIANYTAFLISVGGTDPSDAAVTYRIAITDASPPPPPPPSYPAAWASLQTNGITAVRQGTAVLVRQSFGTPLNSAWQTVWFETPGGKMQAAANGDGLFASPDESMLPIAGFSHILISNAGANENNQIEWRVAIFSDK